MTLTPSRWLTLGLWAPLMLLAGIWLATRLTVTHDLSVFLPSGASPQEQRLLEELQSGQAAQLILLAIEGGDEEQRARASRQLAEQLQLDGEIALVTNGATCPARNSFGHEIGVNRSV